MPQRMYTSMQISLQVRKNIKKNNTLNVITEKPQNFEHIQK